MPLFRPQYYHFYSVHSDVCILDCFFPPTPHLLSIGSFFIFLFFYCKQNFKTIYNDRFNAIYNALIRAILPKMSIRGMFFKAASQGSKSSSSFKNSSGDEIDIRSNDIDLNKITPENWLKMIETFKDYYIPKEVRRDPNRKYSSTEVDDETIARYLIARNNDVEKATELLHSVVLRYDSFLSH